MTPSLMTAVLVSLVGGLLTLLLAAVGYGIKRLITHVDSLQTSLGTLRDSILTLSDRFVTKDQHDRDLASVRAFGRREADRCPAPDCPYEHRVTP